MATETRSMSELDRKINQVFAGLVVRKDLVKLVKGNAVVPGYVLEYLLGQYCATDDEAGISAGIETVREILRRHYVHRNEAMLVQSTIRERGRHKVIDRITVELNTQKDAYEAEFANLGIKKVLIDSATIKQHPKLLVGGVWCIADLAYQHVESRDAVPWILEGLKPIQMSNVDFDAYVTARQEFTTDEWMDALMQSIGFNPEMFSRRDKFHQLLRLIPFVERNFNLIELGPKGTGKSHIYSEFSPHAMLVSGGEITVPKLFVNNSTGKIGLVGYWDVVALDEFAGRKKRANRALVDIMKNYMANKSFSRGIETLGAEASMVFVGNTDHTVPYMLKNTDLFDPLPEHYHDSAFLDRIHTYVPGWEVEIIRGELFTDGFGFIVDYLAEMLRHLRTYDFSDRYASLFTLSDSISTRDRDGINKTFAGLMKLLHPSGEATGTEIEELLQVAMEGRKRVKDQLLRIDSTYDPVRFVYLDSAGIEHDVATLEELEYPHAYHGTTATEGAGSGFPEAEAPKDAAGPAYLAPAVPADTLEPGHVVFQENQRGASFDRLFGPYLRGARTITVTDPYVRMVFQQQNLMELLETVSRFSEPGDEVDVHLITVADDVNELKQTQVFERIQEESAGVGIRFTWEYDAGGTLHDRDITTDHGWKIVLSRGLDVFQRPGSTDRFSFAARMQEHRSCREFNVTYVQLE